MKTALVHDWLTGLRGGERCLEAFLALYPNADIFTLIHVPGTTTKAIDARIKESSFLNKLPGVSKYYRRLLPLYPAAITQFDFKDYDLVISLSHAAAKNINVPKHIPHISFCFTPMRYIWDQAKAYFGKATPILWPVISALRKWDKKGAARVTSFVAISNFIAARIRCFYGRSSQVIYPPVDTSWIKPVGTGIFGDAFLYAGALVPYKRVDLIIHAFNELQKPLWVIGTGPEESKLRALAKSNIKFLGRLSDEELSKTYTQTRALVFAGTEDFGMIPIECMAAGRPVIGLYDGALRETICGLKPWDEKFNETLDKSKITGVFIKPEKILNFSSIISSVKYFMDHEDNFTTSACIDRAKLYSPKRFFDAWENFVRDVLKPQETPKGLIGSGSVEQSSFF